MTQPYPHRYIARITRIFYLALTLLLPTVGHAGEVPEALPAPRSEAPAVQLLDLAQCLHLSEQNPRIVAARASLAAAETQLCALENLHAIPLLPGSRELPIRRKQAALGVEIARAELVRAESDVAYFVKRTYFTVVYAKMQRKVASELVKELTSGYDFVKNYIEVHEKTKSKEEPLFTPYHLTLTGEYLGLSRSREAEAEVGVQRARAALQEAVGAGFRCCFDVADDELPYQPLDACCDDIVSLAITRRSEVVEADLAIVVHQLEVEAQGLICTPTARTFAAGSDIHARVVPPDLFNGEYRPGGLAPEMPVFLVGKKCERQQRAQDYAERAAAVSAKTRNLVALEAKETYLRCVDFARRIQATKFAVDNVIQAEKYGEEKRWFYGIPAKTDPKTAQERLRQSTEDVARRAKTRSEYNEARWRYAIGLAALERVTAGGFCAGVALPPSPPRQEPVPLPPNDAKQP